MSTGEIRISERLRVVPAWVLDAVIVHELAHLIEPSHSPRFRELEHRYPRQQDAEFFLEGYALGLEAVTASTLEVRGTAGPNPRARPFPSRSDLRDRASTRSPSMSGGSHGDGRLRWRCEAAARGEFPEPDWELEIVPAPTRVVAAVCGFTGHYLIATDLPEDEVRRQLGADDPAAPMNPTFLGWLGRRLDANVGHVDLVLAGRGTGSGSNWLRPIAEPPDNERVRRAAEPARRSQLPGTH